MTRRPPIPTLFPSTPPSRSYPDQPAGESGPHQNPDYEPAHHEGKADRKSTRLNSSHGYISYAVFFFLNDPPPPDTYPLPLHAALPILPRPASRRERSTPKSRLRTRSSRG